MPFDSLTKHINQIKIKTGLQRGLQIMLISKENLKEIAGSFGVTQVGITTAEPLLHMKTRLQRRVEEGRVTPFEEKDFTARLSPQHLLKNCRSIITLAIPYTPPDNNNVMLADELRGKVARCARAIDYHQVVEKKAGQIVAAIQKKGKSHFNNRILSDRSPLLERELACNSSLGLIGENCTLINSLYGSYTALGTILIDQEITPEQNTKKLCYRCGECRRICPTGALTEPYIINPYRCLSYLTQASGVLPIEMRPLMGRHIYGCDLCQEACPHNQSVESSPYPELAFHFFPAEPLLIPLLQMTRKEYELSIGLTSAGWRGKTTLQRNAVIALGNSGNPEAIKILTRLLENDPRPLIRRHTAWALGQLGGEKSKYALQKSCLNDPEEEVKKEAGLALAGHT